MSSSSCILVDGSSYLFRAYHALPPLTNKSGEPTGAMYGVLNMLRKMILQEKPDIFVVVFDCKGKTTRHEIYPDYKAHRPEMPEELAAQIEPLHIMIEAMGIPLIKQPGVEADDILGTLACRFAKQGHNVLISTGDKDLAQLVNDKIKLVNTMTETVMDADGVEEKFGVRPERIIDYLSLIGDTSDNIPGIEKVGPKTAVKWLNEFDSVENIIANADKITGKVGDNLRQGIEQLKLSYELVTIDTTLNLDLTEDTLHLKAPDKEKLRELYLRYGFNAWFKALDENGKSKEKNKNNDEGQGSEGDVSESYAESAGQQEVVPTKYKLILDKQELSKLIKELRQVGVFAVDTETTSLNYMQAELVGMSFSYKAKEAYYIPVAHKYADAPVQLEREYLLQELKPLLEDDKLVKIGHNLKYDINVLHKYGIKINNFEDTMLMSYVLNSTKSKHNMDDLAVTYLGLNTIKYTEVTGSGAKQVTFDLVKLEEACPYACEDADITFRLYALFMEKLSKTDDLLLVYRDLEKPLVDVLSSMELTGVIVSATALNKQSVEISERLITIEQEAFVLAGEEFNLSSTKQLGYILFEKLNLPVIKKTPKGQPSTAEEVLQSLAIDFALPELILEYRSLSKLKSTYTDKLPEEINPQTGRVHTSYHQAVAATGRLSSTDPNLQNIPIRTSEGRKIRQAFIAKPGYKLLAADYSQIELRIMAHLSKDQSLLDAFKRGEDIHNFTASEVFATPLDKVTKEQRRRAKAINFGLIYGMSAFGLARQLKLDRQESQAYIDEYFTRYPGVRHYMDDTRHKALEQGYVETIIGRRLYLPDIKSKNKILQKAAQRAAINAPMQGSAADIIKQAMLDIHAWLAETDLDLKMLMQVHDELIFEVKESDVKAAGTKIKELMEKSVKISVPLIVEIGSGNNWDEAH